MSAESVSEVGETIEGVNTNTNTNISSNDVTNFEVKELEGVRKGKSDWREYRAIELENGATCVLVSDKESKTTAMAVSVNVGASADPRELSGLAHFCEHMCFLGSEAYPGENEYKRYLSSHGGQSNASTSMHFTTYKFDILADHAEPAVDRFANFFVGPLFSPSGTAREVNAVDSENSKNLTTDGRRRLQILKAMADPNHHYSKFSTGNATTLPAANSNSDEPTTTTTTDNDSNHVREALLAFHRRHYRPDNMGIVIVGPQSLDTLQSWVVPRFAPMVDRWTGDESSLTKVELLVEQAAKEAPNNKFHQPQPPYFPAFRPELQGGTWPVLLTTKPLRSVRKLVLMFPLPSVRYQQERSPVKILSHLLGHEGKGSSFAALQDAGLVNSLSTGLRISAPDNSLLQIDVSLTERGEERWTDVASVLFDHCRLLSQTAQTAAGQCGNQQEQEEALNELQRIWSEIVKLNIMQFNQTSPGQAYGLAPGLSQSILYNGTKKCMSSGWQLEEDESTLPLGLLVDFALQLNPANCIVERCSQAAWDEQVTSTTTSNKVEEKNVNIDSSAVTFGLQKEKWYGVEYYTSKIDSDTVTRWETDGAVAQEPLGNLHLPTPNRFIPRTLELCADLTEEARRGPRIDKEIDPPNLIVDEPNVGRLWHRLDDRYALPQSSLQILLRNAAVENVFDAEEQTWHHDVDASIRSLILTGVFSDAMAQETYDADLAGLHWSLSKSSSGILLSCFGYSDRLPDLAVQLLQDFVLRPETILRESHLRATKDQVVRNFESYFQSRRADSHAMYYRDLLLSSKGGGIEQSLEAAKSTTLESLLAQHKLIFSNPEMFAECFFTGNVSQHEARQFFDSACAMLKEATAKSAPDPSKSAVTAVRKPKNRWIPGGLERRLAAGEDVELSFNSKNPEEENGAVLVTYQSQIPGWKGDHLSTRESLKSSASIRLICHMMKEPLFDDLRTKQQLGYVVSGYYDLSFSSRPHDLYQQKEQDLQADGEGAVVTPIDFIVVNILSRKLPPTEVAARVDEFLVNFREMLVEMPESQIRDHSDALGQKMLKPIQKLGSEASVHFGKIRRYAPEVLGNWKKRDASIPWDSAKVMAKEIQSLDRSDLLQTWDRVVAGKNRSRVVSLVYGKTFPLEAPKESSSWISRWNVSQNNPIRTIQDLMSKRKELEPFDAKWRREKSFFQTLGRRQKSFGVAAAAFLGVGILGYYASNKNTDSTSDRTTKAR